VFSAPISFAALALAADDARVCAAAGTADPTSVTNAPTVTSGRTRRDERGIERINDLRFQGGW
jgi:hypothetical protein